MWYFVIIISVILIGFFIWMNMDYRKQKKLSEKKHDKQPFRTEEDLDEYGKKMKDGEETVVDFDDAE